MDPLRLSRPLVLRRVAGHCRSQSVQWGHQQAIQLICRSKAVLSRMGDHLAVQNVKLHHHALHHNNTDGKHRKLQSQRKPLAQMPPDIPFGHLPVLPLQTQLGILYEGINKAPCRADQLRCHGGDRRACHSPAEGHDKHQIQPDIENGGKKQEQKRRHRISHAAQKGADKIVEKLCADSREDNGAVGIGGAIHLRAVRRHIDPRQHRAQQQKRQPRQHRGQHRRKDDLCRQRAPHAGIVPRTHLLRRHHAKARADAEGKLQKNKDDRGGIVHPRHLAGSQRLPHYGSVADGVHLLQQIADYNRKGKCQNRFPRHTLGQVSGAEKIPQSKL